MTRAPNHWTMAASISKPHQATRTTPSRVWLMVDFRPPPLLHEWRNPGLLKACREGCTFRGWSVWFYTLPNCTASSTLLNVCFYCRLCPPRPHWFHGNNVFMIVGCPTLGLWSFVGLNLSHRVSLSLWFATQAYKSTPNHWFHFGNTHTGSYPEVLHPTIHLFCN